MSAPGEDLGGVELPWHPRVRVLASGAGWVAVDKPEGVLSHPNRAEESARSVLSLPFDMRLEAFLHPRWGEVHLCHRLDGPTSGVLLLAGSGLAGAIRLAFARRDCQKVYRAWLKGNYPREREVWQDRLGRSGRGKGVRAVVSDGGAEAVAELTVLARTGGPLGFTEVRLQPRTGRTHQLRLQSARRGFPVVGDASYGDFGFNRRFAAEWGEKRLYLHAESLQLDLPGSCRSGKLRIAAVSPVPFARRGG